jgi:hypothetical protein
MTLKIQYNVVKSFSANNANLVPKTVQFLQDNNVKISMFLKNILRKTTHACVTRAFHFFSSGLSTELKDPSRDFLAATH